MKILKEFPYNKIGSFTNNNPFTISFIYTKSKPKGFIVKGGLNDVKKFLKDNITEPYIEHRSCWRHGGHRTWIRFENFKSKIYIYDIYPSTGKKKYSQIKVDYTNIVAEFKRFPRKWIKQLDPFC